MLLVFLCRASHLDINVLIHQSAVLVNQITTEDFVRKMANAVQSITGVNMAHVVQHVQAEVVHQRLCSRQGRVAKTIPSGPSVVGFGLSMVKKTFCISLFFTSKLQSAGALCSWQVISALKQFWQLFDNVAVHL